MFGAGKIFAQQSSYKARRRPKFAKADFRIFHLGPWGCIKDAAILCVRGNKGFCETCMKTVMLIEKNEQGNKEMVILNIKAVTNKL
ncbi:hypothetical protein QYF36_015685 [Acer negundo]|nr:hypothetical protein QYF36_015685 [Acer negundo]